MTYYFLLFLITYDSPVLLFLMSWCKTNFFHSAITPEEAYQKKILKKPLFSLTGMEISKVEKLLYMFFTILKYFFYPTVGLMN